jgi:predicted acyl esterase
MTSEPMTTTHATETRDGMRISWDVSIVMDDGLVLRADVFEPTAPGRYPVILSYGPYAKGLHFEDGYKTAWDIMVHNHPDVVAGTSNKYQSWELVDPEKWVPDGYAIVRVDSRGAGRSPGFIDHWSPEETRDLYECIEWAAAQPFSNGKIGLAGISYYAVNQWQVAALQPPHLAAICVWEGFSDYYRDCNYHGGIPCSFLPNWYDMQVITVQHGYGERGHRSRLTDELVCGPETLSDDELRRNRQDLKHEVASHPTDGPFYRDHSVDFSRIRTPLLSCGNWGGNGLHLRGNIEGFVRAASTEKWLEMHGDTHWTGFYTDYGVALQKRFFGWFLKGERNGWDRQPRLQLQVRHPGERFELRYENEWPLARTVWTRFHLDLEHRTLSRDKPAQPAALAFDALGDGLMFLSPPLAEATEITGPSVAKLAVSSTTPDADLFVVLQVFDPDGKEVTFYGALDPHTPIAQGWLRASHRKLDPALSTVWRPYHTHDEVQPLKPGEIVDLDVEIWPTCLVIPAGYRIGLAVRGKDYVHAGGPAIQMSNMKRPFTGCGPFMHEVPEMRPPEIYGGRTTLHAGGTHEATVLLPFVPPRE